MPKKCEKCHEVREFTMFDKIAGKKKYEPICRSCKEEEVVEKVGLNPDPVVVKPDFDAERARRQQQYRNAMARMKAQQQE